MNRCNTCHQRYVRQQSNRCNARKPWCRENVCNHGVQSLFRGLQVYRITSKDIPKLHFFRYKNGIVTAWEAPFPVDELWNASNLSKVKGIVTVIDPSETKSPVRQDALPQPSIKIPSDNPEKHYGNLNKNNIILYTAPPSGREAHMSKAARERI